MKTPMQELIETFKEIQKDQEPYFFSVNKAIELAESMLEKEKDLPKQTTTLCLGSKDVCTMDRT